MEVDPTEDTVPVPSVTSLHRLLHTDTDEQSDKSLSSFKSGAIQHGPLLSATLLVSLFFSGSGLYSNGTWSVGLEAQYITQLHLSSYSMGLWGKNMPKLSTLVEYW